jgi:arginine exporter protein ArgO
VEPPPYRPPAWATVLSIALIVGLVAPVMYLVTTFLFHFSGGQYRMGAVVDYGALAVVVGTLVLAVIVWKVRSPATALKWTAIATPVAWVVAIVVEWGFSFALGAG